MPFYLPTTKTPSQAPATQQNARRGIKNSTKAIRRLADEMSWYDLHQSVCLLCDEIDRLREQYDCERPRQVPCQGRIEQ